MKRHTRSPQTPQPFVKDLRALSVLSEFPKEVDVDALARMIREAPDPETASEAVVSRVHVRSEVLTRKWREIVVGLWSAENPHVPLLPHLPLTSRDVQDVVAVRDAQAYLKELLRQPASVVDERDEVMLDSEDVVRLACVLPSLGPQAPVAVEHEWAYVRLRRLRAVLQALRLVRIVKGEAVVVQSRYERFIRFPAVQQLYALWHADVYHVGWGDFAGLWREYFRVIQDYLPLLWDLNDEVIEGSADDSCEWCAQILEGFFPLWEQEGLLRTGHGKGVTLGILQQCALPHVLETLLLHDLFVRYGVVTASESEEADGCPWPMQLRKLQLRWTKTGELLLRAERNSDLPCGLTLLDEHI